MLSERAQCPVFQMPEYERCREDPALEGTPRGSNTANALAISQPASQRPAGGSLLKPEGSRLGAYSVLSLAFLLLQRTPLLAITTERCQLLPLSGARTLETDAMPEISMAFRTSATMEISTMPVTGATPGTGAVLVTGAITRDRCHAGEQWWLGIGMPVIWSLFWKMP